MVAGLRNKGARDEGFTLVELLVVMLILGLLAAIAIPSFFNQRDKARDADAKVAARSAATATETYMTDHHGTYTGLDWAGLVAIEPVLIDAPATVAPTAVPNATNDGYTITVTSETGNVFRVTRAPNGETTRTCDLDGDAGCPNDGNWS